METMVTFGSCNRITIPKDIVESLNLKQGTKFKLITSGNDIIIYRFDSKNLNNSLINNCVTHTDEEIKNEQIDNFEIDVENNNGIEQDVKSEGHRFKRKIVSNLEEGANFYAKYYSPCKLVIRTKNRYLKKFCEECKGYLVEKDKDKQSMCPYYKNNEVKQVEQVKQTEPIEQIKSEKQVEQIVMDKQDLNINDMNKKQSVSKEDSKLKTHNTNKVITSQIKENVDKLNDMLNNKIENIDDIPFEYYKKYSSKSIKPIKSDKYFYQCCQCQELVNSGFYIDNEFYCSKCTKKDFKHFYKIYNKMKKGRKDD